MTDNFKKIKTSYNVRAIVLGGALGLCCALIATCALAIAFKLSGISFFWPYYLLIGVGVAALSGTGLYFAFRPTDKALAKKLDKKYALNQKVQTMVECGGEEGVMVELQRRQTDEALAPAAAVKFEASGLLRFIFIPILAVAMLFGGIFVPVKKSQAPAKVEEQGDYETSEYQLATVRRLIDDVQSSTLEQNLKVGFVGALEALASTLENVNQAGEMRREVVAAITFMDGLVEEQNTYLKLGGKQVEYESLKSFAVALSEAANAYKYGGLRLGSMDDVRQKEETAEESAQDCLIGWRGNYISQISNRQQEPASLQEMVESVEQFNSDFVLSLSAFAEQYDNKLNDGLYVALLNLSTDLGAVTDGVSGYTEESFISATEYRFNQNFAAVARTVARQSYNVMMDDYVRGSLAKLFGVTAPPFVTAIKAAEGEGTDPLPDDELSSAGGGAGSGEVHFGTDDVVYDPETDGQVKYTEVLERYKNAVLERIQGGASAEEVAQLIKLYFEKISSYQGE